MIVHKLHGIGGFSEKVFKLDLAVGIIGRVALLLQVELFKEGVRLLTALYSVEEN